MTVQVRVTSALGSEYWYAHCIGQVFDVTPGDKPFWSEHWRVKNSPEGCVLYIDRQDCVIVDEASAPRLEGKDTE